MTTSQKISCPICGHQFFPTVQGCASCPLHQGCSLTCCPACGHTTVDPSRSKLASLVSKWMKGWNKSLPLDQTGEHER